MYWRVPIGPGGIDGLHRHLGAGGIVGIVLLAILWAAIIVALVLGIRAIVLHSRSHKVAYAPGGPTGMGPATGGPSTGMSQPSARTSSTLAILEERYARGEINRDEFLQRKQDLGLGA